MRRPALPHINDELEYDGNENEAKHTFQNRQYAPSDAVTPAAGSSERRSPIPARASRGSAPGHRFRRHSSFVRDRVSEELRGGMSEKVATATGLAFVIE
ncbi:Uncharacterised protein [Mycobacteroides abscessus subsp. abscessus]|nr:hypothetical protein L835_1892 [Mycobacteroides abscessus MAB_110811_1470]ETZ95000.1 hypothetical protein L828_1943 [Mycobacteroides abscessus MAB_030201_1061]SKT57753.1 Uncharacterised protein [Mycobacteroides abscessus subsp. abscessus]